MEPQVGVWWDMESCPLPPSADPFLAMAIPNALQTNFNIQTDSQSPSSNHNSNVKFSAYKFSSPSPSEEEIEVEQTIFNSGIDLQRLHSGRIDEIEKMIMADVLLWAMDVPPPANIIFIVGNVDFSYVFYKLRERLYNVFLVCTSVGQMPNGMLSAANNYLGWLTFLKSLEQSEEKMHLPNNLHGWDPEHYQAFSNTYPSSVSTVSSKEREECHSTSAFDYASENYLTGQTFIGGWESIQPGISPLNEAAATILQPPEGHGFQGHASKCHEKPMGPVESRHRNQNSHASTQPKKKLGSMAEFKTWLRQVVNRKENENGYNISPIRIDFEQATGKNLDLTFLGFQKISNLLEQCKDVVYLKEVKKGCLMAFPVKTSQKKPFKTNIGKANPNPMKGKPESSPCSPICIPNSQPNLNPKPNLKTEADQKSMSKAEKEDFLLFLIQMVYNGSFSQGFLMSKLPKEFELVFRKCLDLEYLGYKKLTNLLEEYSDIVFVDNKGPGPSRIFPSSGFTISNLNFGRSSEEISINMECNLAEQKAGLEINNNSAGGSAENSSDNRDQEEYITEEHLFCQNTELATTGSKSSPMSLSSWPSVSIVPAEEKASAFQEYWNKSDSSGTPPGLHVSAYEGQLPDKVYELYSHGNSGGLEGSECSKEFGPSLQKHGNILIGKAVRTEVSVSEPFQNLRINRENGSGKQAIAVIEPAACQNSSYDIPVGIGLLNGLSSQLDSPILNPKVSCNIPFHPLQLLPKESIDCSGDLQCSTGLDCKENELNAKSEVNKETNANSIPFNPLQLVPKESIDCSGDLQCSTGLDCKEYGLNAKSEVKEETNANSIVSPGGSIIQAAGRGLKTIYEFTGWKKNQ